MRRFIAGAVCPQCGQMDKIVMVLDSADKRRECISCGYSDKLDRQLRQREPETRVNQPRAGESPLAHEDEIQVIKLTDGDPAGSKDR